MTTESETSTFGEGFKRGFINSFVVTFSLNVLEGFFVAIYNRFICEEKEEEKSTGFRFALPTIEEK